MPKTDYVILPSSLSLLVIGVVSAILSPLVGIILGIYFWAKPQIAKEGKIILLVALVWLAVIFADILVF